MKQCKHPVVRGANLAIALAAAIATLSQGAFAARTVSQNHTLSADEDWRADGVVAISEGVTVDLNGHALWLAGLAGGGAFTTSAPDAAFTDLTGSGAASSTIDGTPVESAGNDKYPASNVFDDDPDTFFYYSGFSSQLEINYDFGTATYVNSYKIFGWSKEAYKSVPKSWVFQGFDGAEWKDLDTQSNQSFAQNEEKTFTFFSNNASFSKYRIKVTEIASGTRLYIYEIQLGVAKNQLRIDSSQAISFAEAANAIHSAIDCVLTGGKLASDADLRGVAHKITLEGNLDLNGNALKVYALDGAGAITSTASVPDGTTPLTTTDTGSLSDVVTVRANGTKTSGHESYPAINAFDNVATTAQSAYLNSTTFPADFIYDFTTPTAVNRYTIAITDATTQRKRAPRVWKLYGASDKDDSATWVELDSREMEKNADGEVQYAPAAECSFANTTPYRYYILRITECGNGGTNLQLNEIEYFYEGDGNYVSIEPAGLAESDLSGIEVSPDVDVTASGNVTLSAATDWTAAGTVSLSGTIDLAGHDLRLSSLSGDAVITNSAPYGLTVADVASPTTFYETNSGTAENAFSNTPQDGDPRVMVAEANWPMVIDCDFQEASVVDTYRIWTFTANRSPGAWKIYGSNDAAAFGSAADDLTHWTELDSRSDKTWSSAYEMHQYDFVNTTAYRYYRFCATESSSTQAYINIWKLQYGSRAQTAAVRVNVPQGAAIDNTGVELAGDLRLVKEGAGTLVASKRDQTYTCGTVVSAGTLECGAERSGAPVGTCEIVTVGEDGVLEMNGKGGYGATLVVLDGGTLQNSVTVGTGGSGNLGRLKLLADSTLACRASTYFGDNASTSAEALIDLGGRTLDIELGTSTLRLYNTTIMNGTLDVVDGGAIISGGDWGVEARTVDLIARCKLDISGPMAVKNYTSLWTGDNGSHDNALSVYGVFTPATTHFYGATLMGGATLDLSNLDGPLDISSSAAGGRTALSFDDNATITVDVGSRKCSNSTCLLSWAGSTAPSNLDTLEFVCPGGDTRAYCIRKESDGLYYAGVGLTIIFR